MGYFCGRHVIRLRYLPIRALFRVLFYYKNRNAEKCQEQNWLELYCNTSCPCLCNNFSLRANKKYNVIEASRSFGLHPND